MNIWNVNVFITFILNTEREINSAGNIEKKILRRKQSYHSSVIAVSIDSFWMSHPEKREH